VIKGKTNLFDNLNFGGRNTNAPGYANTVQNHFDTNKRNSESSLKRQTTINDYINPSQFNNVN
jgi:hypothetical protein